MPPAAVDFIEHNTTPASNNAYADSGGDEGSNIYFNFTTPQQTPQGTLTLRPETKPENETIIMNVDFTAAAPLFNASVTLHVPTGFTITDTSTVTIGDEASETADTYDKTEQRITVTGITATENTTVTLRLSEADVPEGISLRGLTKRDIEYPFTAKVDADGSGTVWEVSPEAVASFTSQEVSTSTTFRFKEEKNYLNLITDPSTKIQYATGTIVASMTSVLEGADGKPQTYEVSTTGGTLSSETVIPETATLTVISQWGETYKADYPIEVIYIRLATGTTNVSWHESNTDAADAAGADKGQITLFTDTIMEGSAITIDATELTIEPADSYGPVTIDGDNSHRVFKVTNSSSVTLRNLHIINGNSINEAGGIYSEDSTLTLDTCEIRSNTAKDDGGGIYYCVWGDSGSLFVRNSTITAN